MADARLIDANSVCKKIVESIRCAEEWANEAKEQQDTHGLRCASEAKTSLLAMLARIHDEPTIEAEPDKMLRDTIAELCQAKRLLKAAVEDIHELLCDKKNLGGNGQSCNICSYIEQCSCCEECTIREDLRNWRYADVAVELIGEGSDSE